MQTKKWPLEEQRRAFSNRKFLATPLSGLIIWAIIGIVGFLFPTKIAVWTIFIGTGSIVYLALLLSKLTGENFVDNKKPRNQFDRLFFYSAAQALMVYSIAIPFFLVDYTSLPMTVGILTGLMWIPFSWIIKHWVGIFHTAIRTFVVLFLWYQFPEHRFVSIPIAIVFIYVITLIVLSERTLKTNSFM